MTFNQILSEMILQVGGPIRDLLYPNPNIPRRRQLNSGNLNVFYHFCGVTKLLVVIEWFELNDLSWLERTISQHMPFNVWNHDGNMVVSMGIPQARWMVYFMENSFIEWMRTGGTPFLGNLWLCCAMWIFSSWVYVERSKVQEYCTKIHCCFAMHFFFGLSHCICYIYHVMFNIWQGINSSPTTDRTNTCPKQYPIDM